MYDYMSEKVSTTMIDDCSNKLCRFTKRKAIHIALKWSSFLVQLQFKMDGENDIRNLGNCKCKRKSRQNVVKMKRQRCNRRY